MRKEDEEQPESRARWSQAEMRVERRGGGGVGVWILAH